MNRKCLCFLLAAILVMTYGNVMASGSDHDVVINHEMNEDAKKAPANLRKVQGIAEFNLLPDGTEAQLYLSDEVGARVTFAYGNDAYIRDKGGALCLYQFVKTPVMTYNQHIAGYITGKKSTVGNMPVMLATVNTNTDQLVIAQPVTESNTQPVVITIAEASNHSADWVLINNVEVSSDGMANDGTATLKVVNAFNTVQCQQPSAGTKINLSCIVNAVNNSNNCLSPVHNVAENRDLNPNGNFYEEFLPIVTGIVPPITDDLKNNVIYDLMGRRVNPAHMGKGIYIMNGKKIVK